MQAFPVLQRSVLLPVGSLLLIASLLRGTSVGQEPGWQAEAYRDFSPEHRAATRDRGEIVTEPGLKLIRTTVQRPRLRPGDAASLKAEYLIGAAGGGIMVKETRVITFNGATVATLERDVRRSSGSAGSELQLRVPRDAAEGWYTLTTTIQPATSTRDTTQVEGSTGFYVDAPAGIPPAAPGAARPPQPKPTPARTTPQPDEEPSIKLVADKARYRVGESVTLRVEASRDGFLTLVNVGTSGKLTVLFPNRFSPTHEVKAGKIYAIPEPKDNYELVLQGPAGSELVYALFTLRPMKFVETDFSGTTQIFPSITQGAANLTRDINVVVKRTPLKEQTRKVLELEVVE
jgi:Domain of unknown function (DUF4384)